MSQRKGREEERPETKRRHDKINNTKEYRGDERRIWKDRREIQKGMEQRLRETEIKEGKRRKEVTDKN